MAYVYDRSERVYRGDDGEVIDQDAQQDIRDAFAVASERWAENLVALLAAGAKIALLGTGEVALAAPVSPSNLVTLYEGDTYDADESRSLEWSTSDSGTWPDLTGATVTLYARQRYATGMETFTASGSVVAATGANKQVRVELAPATTTGKRDGNYLYQVVATLPNGHVVTLTEGVLKLKSRAD